MIKAVLDTNLYIDWLNDGAHEDLMVGPGLVRFLSSIVLMELRIGATTDAARRAVARLQRAYEQNRRLVAPSHGLYAAAGDVLRRLKHQGVEIRRASLVDDVLIALCAQSIGATLFTADTDYTRISRIVPVTWKLISI